MKKTFLIIQLAIIFFSIDAFAQTESPIKARFLIEGGIELGGDEVLTVFFTNGGEQTMTAGQGGYIVVGTELSFPQVKNLLIRTSAGIKYVTTAADDANIRLTRIPINIIPYWKIKDNFRLGVGISSHQNIKLKGDGFISDITFTSAIGPRFEFGYKWASVTYTALNYRANTGESLSANSIGFAVSFTFPK